MTRIGAIILAAGKSTRMGRPKPLIPWNGRPLVLHAMDAAIQAGADPVWVVTGADAGKVEALLEDQPVRSIRNPHFERGMGSSIRKGFETVIHEVDVEAAFLLLCDQPAVSASLLQSMRQRTAGIRKGLVACTYAGTFGPPLLVSRPFFPEFARTEPESGARLILRRNETHLLRLPFPEGAADVDTPADLEQPGSR
ncbi:MAG: nucleotidyltransferase family protein [Oceanipulchritudo sp.]